MSKKDLIKVLKGAGIALIGALAAYGTQLATDQDLGQWGPLLGAGCAILTNIIRKWKYGNKR